MDCSQGHVHSMLNPRPEEIELHDRLIQEWLVTANMEEPESADEPQAEAEMPSTTAEVGPSTTTSLLANLAQKVDKLEADIGAVLANQQYIINLLNNIQ